MKIDRNSPLNPQDSPAQTYGCRHTNPDVCSNYEMEDVCAFVREDKICKKPPGGWKKQYEILLAENPYLYDQGKRLVK